MTAKRFIEFATQQTDNGEINNGFQDIKTGEWYYTKDSENAEKICDLLNKLHEENQHYKHILQDLGLLMSDEEVRDIRTEIADKFIKPLCKENGFDIDVDCTNGFTIIPKGDEE